jgi:hypothetical protein
MKKTFQKISFVLSVLVFFTQCNKENNTALIVFQNDANPQTSNATIPKPDHIVVLIEENHAYEQIIGSDSARYINSLIKDPSSATFTKSFAITYGSQVDYLDLYSGANQGAGGAGHPIDEPFITPNLGRQLIDAGKSYSTYSQSLPSTGYNGDTYLGYVRIHNPAANWMGTNTNQIPRTTNKRFTAFPTDYTQLPIVSFVIPNVDHDMHDGTISEGDLWLKKNMDNYIQWAKTHNSLFILTFDEDDGKHSNHITTIFSGSAVKGGQDTTQIKHYNILRTIEDMYGLPHAGNAAFVKPITNCWK